jgi:hypothetical protein
MLGHVHADAIKDIEVQASYIQNGVLTFDYAVNDLMKRYSHHQYHEFELVRGAFEFELLQALKAPDTDDFPPRDAIETLRVRSFIAMIIHAFCFTVLASSCRLIASKLLQRR